MQKIGDEQESNELVAIDIVNNNEVERGGGVVEENMQIMEEFNNIENNKLNLSTTTTQYAAIEYKYNKFNTKIKLKSILQRLLFMTRYLFVYFCLPMNRRKNKLQLDTTRKQQQPNESIIEDSISHHNTYMLHYTSMTLQQQLQFKQFLLDFGYYMCLYGAPGFRVEYYLNRITDKFEVESQYYITPAGIFSTYGARGTSHVEKNLHFVQLKSTQVDITKLCYLIDLANDFAEGYFSTIEDAHTKLKEIIAIKTANMLIDMPLIAITGPIYCALLNGTYVDIACSFIISLIVSVLYSLAPKVAIIAKTIRITIPIVAGLFTLMLKIIVWYLNQFLFVSKDITPLPYVQELLVLFSAIVIFLPALVFAISVIELSVGAYVTGIYRFITGVMNLLQLGFGILLTHKLSSLLTTFQTPEKYKDLSSIGYPFLFSAFLLYCFIAILIILLRIPKYPFSIVVVYAACTAAFFGLNVLVEPLGRELAVFFSSFVVHLLANFFNRLSKHPNLVVTSISLVLMIPGSLGLNGLFALMTNEYQNSIQLLYTLIMSANCTSIAFILSQYIIPTINF